MFRIRVEKTLTKNIDAVFDALADHENYHRFPGITVAELLEEGSDERNGEGALRRVGGGGVEFIERIISFERPTRMAYRIERSKPVSIRHDKGEIKLTAEGDGTRVLWVSEGHIELPIIGSLLDKLSEKRTAAAFAAVLGKIESM